MEREFRARMKRQLGAMMFLENLVDFLSSTEGDTEEEIDEELRRAGLDPDAVGQRMVATARQALAELRDAHE